MYVIEENHRVTFVRSGTIVNIVAWAREVIGFHVIVRSGCNTRLIHVYRSAVLTKLLRDGHFSFRLTRHMVSHQFTFSLLYLGLVLGCVTDFQFCRLIGYSRLPIRSTMHLVE